MRLILSKTSYYLVWALFLFCVCACGGGGGGSASDDGAQSPESPSSPAQRVWTVAEILSEPVRGGSGGSPSCGGEFGFKRCICPDQVPSYVRYRPAVLECNSNAAAILSGRLNNAFSIVVRDTQNRDRWPEAGSGFGGCSFNEANADAPPNNCSAFKAQSRFEVGDGSTEVYCFGASGYSDIFIDAARLTVKLSDDPFSNDDDIERFCLRSPSEPLN
jgi:hypothetical protein